MSASLHLARYPAHEVPRMLRRMWRHRAALQRTPGLQATRVFALAVLDPYLGGTPTLRRWGLLCGWDSRESRDAYLAHRTAPPAFLEGARESWTLSLDTARVLLGDWHGWTPSTDGVEPLTSDGPVAVMTYARLRPRHVPAFAIENRRIIRTLQGDPGMTFSVGMGDHPLSRCTFSLWRSKGEMVRFSYGDGPHNPVQQRSLDVPWGHDFFFARFRPVASAGTWDGRDPLADLGGLPA